MTYPKSSFISFPADSGRVVANLEAAYEQWHDARQKLAKLPASIYWKTVGEKEYLGVKLDSASVTSVEV